MGHLKKGKCSSLIDVKHRSDNKTAGSNSRAATAQEEETTKPVTAAAGESTAFHVQNKQQQQHYLYTCSLPSRLLGMVTQREGLLGWESAASRFCMACLSFLSFFTSASTAFSAHFSSSSPCFQFRSFFTAGLERDISELNVEEDILDGGCLPGKINMRLQNGNNSSLAASDNSNSHIEKTKPRIRVVIVKFLPFFQRSLVCFLFSQSRASECVLRVESLSSTSFFAPSPHSSFLSESCAQVQQDFPKERFSNLSRALQSAAAAPCPPPKARKEERRKSMRSFLFKLSRRRRRRRERGEKELSLLRCQNVWPGPVPAPPHLSV